MSEYIISEDEARNLVMLARIEAENAEQLDAAIAANMGRLGYFALPEVVRCMDCECFTERAVCTNGFIDGEPDAFCAWGERRDA